MSDSVVMKKSKELRNDPSVHYNCAQAVFIPFALMKGISFEDAAAITDNFGGGMRMGLTCGAITGGLMVLGLYGVNSPRDAAMFIQMISHNHNNMTSCRDLLASEVHDRSEKKPHCDKLVYEAVDAVETILKERNISIGETE